MLFVLFCKYDFAHTLFFSIFARLLVRICAWKRFLRHMPICWRTAVPSCVVRSWIISIGMIA